MGTDIHLWVERRENGKWVSADKWSKNEYDDAVNAPLRVSTKDEFYGNRNYDLFAILADVRNGRGFAGIETGTGFNIIAEPRGWPDDCSPEVAWEGDHIEHTPTWLLLSEILAFDWTQTTKHYGWVTPKEWAAWKLQGKPRGWSGGVSGGGVKHVSNEEMERAARAAVAGERADLWALFHDKANAFGDGGVISERIAATFSASSVYTRVEWEEPYYESCNDFWGSAIPRLLRVGKPEDVRLVFYFDS